jgi:hypothetical protein
MANVFDIQVMRRCMSDVWIRIKPFEDTGELQAAQKKRVSVTAGSAELD